MTLVIRRPSTFRFKTFEEALEMSVITSNSIYSTILGFEEATTPENKYFRGENDDSINEPQEFHTSLKHVYHSLLFLIESNTPWIMSSRFLFNICYLLEDATFSFSNGKTAPNPNSLMLVPVLRIFRRWRMDAREGKNLENLAFDLALLADPHFELDKGPSDSAIHSNSFTASRSPSSLNLSFPKPIPPRLSRTLEYPMTPQSSASFPSHIPAKTPFSSSPPMAEIYHATNRVCMSPTNRFNTSFSSNPQGILFSFFPFLSLTNSMHDRIQ